MMRWKKLVMMLLETESIKKSSHKSAGIHFIIEPYVTLTFSFNFTAAYLLKKKIMPIFRLVYKKIFF